LDFHFPVRRNLSRSMRARGCVSLTERGRSSGSIRFGEAGAGSTASSSMFGRLRQLFSAKPAEVIDPNAPVSLAEVLKRGWLELWYQPKIELRTMRLVGAEALVRARHPSRGVLPPAAFLPNASEDDMHALTEHVLVTALKDWTLVAEHGVSMKFAVNVPVSAFVKLPIAQILREERPRAANWPGLILEVTEDQIIHDLDLANDVA